jgi:putative transcriptional regulator
LIVNRRYSLPAIRVFGDAGGSPRSDAMAFFGGPVSRDAVLALVRSKTRLDDARLVARDIHVVTTREAMEKRLQAGADAAVFRVYLGRGGWGPGQLESEVAIGAWHVFDADAAVVFDSDPDTMWDRQIRRSTWLQASRH